MTPYEAYVMYNALKMHFTTEAYDYIKYNGKYKTSTSTFETRKDKFFFHKLSRKKDVKEFLIANFTASNAKWIGDLVNDLASEEIYTAWKKRTQALGYMFEEDLKRCLTNIDENLKIKEQQHPFMLKLFLRKKISIETMIILNDLVNFMPRWNKALHEDVIWKDVFLLCRKYKPFLEYDRKKMKAIALKVFGNGQSDAA